MSRIETVMYKCDWCGVEEPPRTDRDYDKYPNGWEALDGLGVCDDLCAVCVAGGTKLLRIVKDARLAGIPFDQAILVTPGVMANQSEGSDG